ncbi:MAG: SDH family Clp fold serine proteinase [Candidatus Hinthialibacter sp.]
MYNDRKQLYEKLENLRGSKVLVYFTGDRRQLETKIGSDVIDFFTHHLDLIYKHDRISLYLYTRGGDTLAAWSLVNLIRQFADYLEVIVPAKAHSAGTLMSLGANAIIMTKQATLGPIDPSVNTPLNPQVPGASPHAKVPVSVEDLNAFVEYCRQTLGPDAEFSELLLSLSEKVHPLVLGNAFRARGQIRMLAKKLLANQNHAEEKMEELLRFLCSESGSHDYTINRREARDELGLPIEKPDDELYALIKAIYDDIASELELALPYDPNSLLGTNNDIDYCLPRALVESVAGGSHSFSSEGRLVRTQVQPKPGVVQVGIQDNRTFEGWRHVNG